MNDYAEARIKFRGTDEFKKTSDPSTMGGRVEMRQFLENRLIRAFDFGVTAGERIAAERLARFVRGEGK